jgi:hypothetical protein
LIFLRLKGNKVVAIDFFWMGSVKFAPTEWRKRSGICPNVLISVAFLFARAVMGD